MNNPEAVAWTMAAEGSFSIQKVRNSLQPKISINNTKQEFLDKFHTMIGYGSTGTHSWNERNPNWNPIHHWYISSHLDCLRFCAEVYEFMPIKQEQVKLMIEFCSRGVARGHGCQSKAEPRDFEIYEKMKELNKRGKEV